MAQLHFDPNQHEPESDFSAIPKDEYKFFISESSIQDAAKQGNQFLLLKVQILEGQYKGCVIFDRLNLVNSNPVAVDIANRRLSSICRACGITTAIVDSTQLHNIPMSGLVDIEEDPGYPPKNIIKSYSTAKSAVAGANNRPPVQSQAAPSQAQQQTVDQGIVQAQQPVSEQPWGNPQTNTNTPPWA